MILVLRGDLPFDPAEHPLEFMFQADFVADRGDPPEADLCQMAVEWVGPKNLASFRF